MVRTRFAPSPTGYMHVGNLRTALFTYLIAKANDGTFILRIEDTDLERQVEGSLEIIYSTLDMVGLHHDEGPDVGGDFGPYIQTDRKDIYQEYAQKLVDQGDAYYCFCTEERLDALRAEQEKGFKYDRHCYKLSEEEVKEKLDAGEPYVIRQVIPEGETTYNDLVYGKITFQNEELQDQILLKSDGLPTYNFANVVDDHLMEITHVVRGNEYLSSAPNYNILYDSFGWTPPEYVHLPLVLNEEGDKLSKRKGDSTFEELVEDGYLPEAVLNFMALLGWAPGSTEEFFTLEELVEVFDVKGISKSPSVFDMDKLKWMNTEYFKKMDKDRFYEMALPTLKETVKTEGVDYKWLAETVQSRVSFIKDIEEMLDFVDELPEYSTDLYVHKKMKTTVEDSNKVLSDMLPDLKEMEWERSNVYNLIKEYADEHDLKMGGAMWPLRTALSGKEQTPCGAIDLFVLLGQEESIKRIEKGIELTNS